MKVLAIDYGAKKTGLAISDELGMVSAKLPVLFADKDKDKIEGIMIIVTELEPHVILFGVPTNWEGKDTEQSKEIKAFIELFQQEMERKKERLGYLPEIKTWDESFTSQRAEQGKKKRYKKEKADSEAARLLLQEYLDSDM